MIKIKETNRTTHDQLVIMNQLNNYHFLVLQIVENSPLNQYSHCYKISPKGEKAALPHDLFIFVKTGLLIYRISKQRSDTAKQSAR